MRFLSSPLIVLPESPTSRNLTRLFLPAESSQNENTADTEHAIGTYGAVKTTSTKGVSNQKINRFQEHQLVLVQVRQLQVR